MRARLYQGGIAGFWVVALFVFVNCGAPGERVEGVLSGGGRIFDGTSAATFTFRADNCGSSEGEPITGGLNYIDKANGVHFDGDVTDATICAVNSFSWNGTGCSAAGTLVCDVGDYMFRFDYTPKQGTPGGTGGACITDNGKGRNSSGPDEGAVQLTSGLYNGYSKSGEMNGNGQVFFCN